VERRLTQSEATKTPILEAWIGIFKPNAYSIKTAILAAFLSVRCYASAILAMALCLSVSVSLSVTSWNYIKMAKHVSDYTNNATR